MHLTTIERLRKAIGKKTPRKNELKILRTRLWLEYIFRYTGLSRKQLDIQLSNNKLEPTKHVIKWLKGDNCATANSVSKVARLVCPQSEEFFDLPLFELLEPSPLTNKQLDALMNNYMVHIPLKLWNFPINTDNTNIFPQPPLVYRGDSEALAERGDIYGFMAILYLIRKAENDNDIDAHIVHMSHAYNAFAGFARHVNFRHRWKELLEALQVVQARLPVSSLLIIPDIEAISKQMHAKEHKTMRYLREWSHKSFRFNDIERAYKQAEITYV